MIGVKWQGRVNGQVFVFFGLVGGTSVSYWRPGVLLVGRLGTGAVFFKFWGVCFVR